MKNRYLSIDAFHELAKSAGDQPVQAGADEQIVVLATQIPEVRALGGHDSRLVEFIISDESIDRMADSVKADGWETENFEKNPVVLWAHSHYDPPVGKATTLDILKKQKQVRSVTEFTPRDLNPLGYMVYQMYVQRFMHAVSVGFKPKEYTWVSSDTDAERARRGGIDFLKQELLEYSAVPVPANPNAVAVARSAGIDTTPLKAWAERVLDESTSRGLSAGARQHMEELRAIASSTGSALIIELNGMKDKAANTEQPPAPTAAETGDIQVKEVVVRRWDCGQAGHTHEEKADAIACIDFDGTLAKNLDTLGTLLKAGRVLSKKNEEALRAAADSINNVLSQLGSEEEGDKSAAPGENSESPASVGVDDMFAGIDPAQIDALVRSTISEKLNTLTGRVD